MIDAIRGLRNGAKVTDVKGDPGGGAVAQAVQFNAAGDDTNPLPGDYAVYVELPSGAYASTGNIDPKNAQTAQPGERRVYGRNAAGEQVCEIHWKSDGEISMRNDKGSHTVFASGAVESVNGEGFYKLLASGVVDINGFTIQPDGTAASPTAITAPTVGAGTSLTVNSTEVLGHSHPAGTPPGNTGGMNP